MKIVFFHTDLPTFVLFVHTLNTQYTPTHLQSTTDSHFNILNHSISKPFSSQVILIVNRVLRIHSSLVNRLMFTLHIRIRSFRLLHSLFSWRILCAYHLFVYNYQPHHHRDVSFCMCIKISMLFTVLSLRKRIF